MYWSKARPNGPIAGSVLMYSGRRQPSIIGVSIGSVSGKRAISIVF
jgi:hypothetical protein